MYIFILVFRHLILIFYFKRFKYRVPSMGTTVSKEWMLILKDELAKYPGSIVCSLHFHSTDMLMKWINGKKYVKLKEGAVPKISPSIDTSAVSV